ncbi:MAG: type IX secretion system protein PorQ [Bacteroidales bacterium]|nr:type IX secretion system protein PorQ [Bacteroidales bacterium]
MIRLTFFIMMLLINNKGLVAQPGGKAFQFLDVTNSARVAAIGGKAPAVFDDDLNMPFHNPGLLNDQMHNHVVLNYVDYFAGINYGYVSYARSYEGIGNFALGIHYLNYGKFQGADETGAFTKTFRASDYALNIIYSRRIDSLFSVGINLKPIYSSLESYNSFALAVDAGVVYHNPGVMFTAALVLRNVGIQVSTYYPNGEREPLPFDIQLGLSQGLKHAPLRFFIMGDHLEKWDLTYQTEEDKEGAVNELTGETTDQSKFDVFADKFMRHVTLGGEVLIGKNVVVSLGYNYRRRQEMKIDSKPGLVGFSFGLSVRITKFRISYGRPFTHLAGGSNHFSLGLNLNEFYKKF